MGNRTAFICFKFEFVIKKKCFFEYHPEDNFVMYAMYFSNILRSVITVCQRKYLKIYMSTNNVFPPSIATMSIILFTKIDEIWRKTSCFRAM